MDAWMNLSDGAYIIVTGRKCSGTLYFGTLYRGVFHCKAVFPAVLGRGGMGKKEEGDEKTPVGLFSVSDAYGIKDNPGCKIAYHRITEQMYWCTDIHAKEYNRLVYSKEEKIVGEHLSEYVPEYHYLLDIGYNKAGIPALGSGIFLHCRGRKNDTSGCIAIEELQMRILLQWIPAGTKILILAV